MKFREYRTTINIFWVNFAQIQFLFVSQSHRFTAFNLKSVGHGKPQIALNTAQRKNHKLI